MAAQYGTTTILQPLFRDYPGVPVPGENFWTLWCKGRLTEADTDHPAGHHSIRTNQCPPPPSRPIWQAIIFSSCRFYLSSFFFFFPRLFSAVEDWMSTILPHMMWS